MQVFQMVSVYNSHTMKLDIKNDLCCSKKFKKKRKRERERERVSTAGKLQDFLTILSESVSKKLQQQTLEIKHFHSMMKQGTN